MLEVVLHSHKILDEDMDLVDSAIPFRDSIGLLVELGEDEGELLLNLHGD